VNIFFDVDETILAYDGALRPSVGELFQRLTAAGHRVFVWSGARSARSVREGVVRRHRLEAYVTDCFQKPIDDPRAEWLATGINVYPDFCVDDRREIVEVFGGIVVAPYPYSGPDDEMLRVYDAIEQQAREPRV
jgi:hypothetical protein